MVTKGIIEELLDDGKQARVRIPFYDKVKGAADATLTQDLNIASTSIIPGCYPVYNIGDIVFVAFEENSLDKPVIIGLLYANDNINSTCDISAQSLVATVNSKLPEDTIIYNTNIDNGNILNEIYNFITDNANAIPKSDLVTQVNASSTDYQVPSAKLFYDTIGDVESVLENLLSGTS